MKRQLTLCTPTLLTLMSDDVSGFYVSSFEPSEDGEYESYFVPVMAACAGVGEVVFDDWVDWVLRGHHGEKQRIHSHSNGTA